jgi:hypothetical protein
MSQETISSTFDELRNFGRSVASGAGKLVAGTTKVETPTTSTSSSPVGTTIEQSQTSLHPTASTMDSTAKSDGQNSVGKELSTFLRWVGKEASEFHQDFKEQEANPAFQAALADFRGKLALDSALRQQEEKQKAEKAQKIAASVYSSVGSVSVDEGGLLNSMVGMDADMLKRVKAEWETLYPDEGGFDSFVRENAGGWTDGAHMQAEVELILNGDPGAAAAFTLHRAMAGAGTDISLLETTFASLSDSDRKRAIGEFNTRFGVDSGAFFTDLTLQDWLDSDLDGEDFQRVVALMNGDKAAERAVRLRAAEAGHWLSTDSTDQKTQEDTLKECKSEAERDALMRRLGVMPDAEYSDAAAAVKAQEDGAKHVAANGLPSFLSTVMGDAEFARYNKGAKKLAVTVLKDSGDAATRAYVQSLLDSESWLLDARNDKGYGDSEKSIDHDVMIGLATGDTAGATAAMLERSSRDGDASGFGDALAALGKSWGDYSAMTGNEKSIHDVEFRATMEKVRAAYQQRYGGGDASSYENAMLKAAGVAPEANDGEKSKSKEYERLKQLDASGRMARAFQAFYSIDGLGTHDDLLKDSVAGTSSEDTVKMSTEYASIAEKFTGDKTRDLAQDIHSDTSGDLRNDVALNAKYGEQPTTVQAKLAKEREQRTYDKGGNKFDLNGMSGGFSGVVGLFSRQDNILQDREGELANLEARYARATGPERDAISSQIDQIIARQKLDREGLRKDRDIVSDRAAQLASIAASLATLGAGGVVSALVAGATQIVTKSAIKGEAYSDSEAMVDVISTGAQALTAGYGDKLGENLLKSQTTWVGQSLLRESFIKGLPGLGLGFASDTLSGSVISGYAQKGIDYDGSDFLQKMTASAGNSLLGFGGSLLGGQVAKSLQLNKAHAGALTGSAGASLQAAASYNHSNPWAFLDATLQTGSAAASGYLGGLKDMKEDGSEADSKVLAQNEPPPGVDPDWHKATRPLPPGLSNEEILRERGFTDEELAIYKNSIKKDAQSSISIDDPRTPAIDEQARDRPDLNRDGSKRQPMSDEEKHTLLRAAFLLSQDLTVGADGRKVIPTKEVGAILAGSKVKVDPKNGNKIVNTGELRGDLGFLGATRNLLPESVVRLLGLDYGRLTDGKFSPNGDYAAPHTDTEGHQGARPADAVLNDGVHTIDFQYTKEMIDQMQIPAGADMVDYTKKVAAWFQADGVEAPWLLKLKNSGPGGATNAAADRGDWGNVELENVVQRPRLHQLDPSTGKMFAASHGFDASGEGSVTPNVEFTIGKKAMPANTAMPAIPEGALLKKVNKDGAEVVVAKFDGTRWIMSGSLAEGEQAKYSAMTESVQADIKKHNQTQQPGEQR